MAVTFQRAWNIATELAEKSDLLNRLMSRIADAKTPEGEPLTQTQLQNIRTKATVIAREMQTLLNELLAP